MTVEDAVVERLLATAAIAAIVDTRVYLLILPQSPTYPAVRVQLVDEPTELHLRGADALTRARVQTDVFVAATTGDPYATAAEVADAIDASLVGAPFTVGTSTPRRVTGAQRVTRLPTYEGEELRLVRMMQDFYIWSRPV